MAAERRSNTFLWIGIALFSIVIAVVMTFVSADYARSESIREAQKIEGAFGESTLLTINRISEKWYRQVENELSSPMHWAKAHGEESTVEVAGYSAKRFWTWLEGRTEALLDLGYWFLRRVALFVIWTPFWIPMFLMAVAHGYWDREVKKTDFGYTSPVLNQASRRVMHLTVLIVMMCFVVPLALEPWIFPFFMAIVTVMSGIAVGNVQKRI